MHPRPLRRPRCPFFEPFVMIKTSMHDMTFFIRTFGCQMNDRDTERISALLNDAGFLRAHDPSQAHVLLLNTCSIREKAEVKVYSELGRLRKLKESRPSMVIGVGGCVAQQEGEKLLERVPD